MKNETKSKLWAAVIAAAVSLLTVYCSNIFVIVSHESEINAIC